MCAIRSRAKSAFLFINFTLALIGFAGMVFFGIGLGNDGELLNGVIAPTSWLDVLIILASAIFLISSLGLIGVILKSRLNICLFLFLNFGTLVFMMFIGISFIIFAKQGVEVSQANNPVIAGLVNDLSESVFIFSYEESDDWFATQELFDCCGIDLEKTYRPPLNGKTLSAHLSGSRCNITFIEDFQKRFPILNDEALAAAAADPVIGDASDGYFCFDNVVQTVQARQAEGIAILASIAILQAVSGLLIMYLLCCLDEQYGGFARINEETTITYSRNGGLRFGNDNPQPFYNNIRQNIGRMSMRMGFNPRMSYGDGNLKPMMTPMSSIYDSSQGASSYDNNNNGGRAKWNPNAWAN